MTVAVTSSWARDTLDRAARRSHDAGQHVDLLACRYSPDVSVDTVVALDSPAEEPDPTPALSAMAHGRAVIVFEREATAGWPALDPQTWRPRQPLDQRSPIVVSIDPRDQEHSLTLALQGMAGNPGRRQQLGLAARAWWQAHATPQHASAAWVDVLAEAATLAPPALPSDWPAHLRVDGAESLRAVLADMGVDSRPLGSGFAG